MISLVEKHNQVGNGVVTSRLGSKYQEATGLGRLACYKSDWSKHDLQARIMPITNKMEGRKHAKQYWQNIGRVAILASFVYSILNILGPNLVSWCVFYLSVLPTLIVLHKDLRFWCAI